jgi:Domain of unknown function (DUF4111)
MSSQSQVPNEVAAVAARLLADVKNVFGDRLVALYLFGSATTCAFESGISDIDTVAVLAGDPTDPDVAALASLHENLARENPEWNDRIEVDYVSAEALSRFRAHSWPAARISPGEQLHRIEIDRRWITDWYQVLTNGVTLCGPPPDQVFPSIPQAEFVEAVRDQLQDWPNRVAVASTPGQLAYAALTLCRALGVCLMGDLLSKKSAAAWAVEELPDLRSVIENAIAWRYSGDAKTRLRQPDREDVLRLCHAIVARCTKREEAK